jgi:hypothetical protein
MDIPRISLFVLYKLFSNLQCNIVLLDKVVLESEKNFHTIPTSQDTDNTPPLIIYVVSR